MHCLWNVERELDDVVVWFARKGYAVSYEDLSAPSRGACYCAALDDVMYFFFGINDAATKLLFFLAVRLRLLMFVFVSYWRVCETLFVVSAGISLQLFSFSSFSTIFFRNVLCIRCTFLSNLLYSVR